MPTPPLLPVDELLAPLDGEDPAGDSVPFGVRQKLEEFRKEINPNDFDADDPLRPEQPKRADWGGLESLAVDTLKSTSKDLLVAARLTEALVKQHGFAGARDGLQLLRRLVEDCWDRMNPKIEDGDIEVRAGPFNWLDDPDRGARFPTTLQSVALVELGEQGFGWQQWKLIQEGKSPATADQFEQAVMATPVEICRQRCEDIDLAVQELEQLNQALVTRMESAAPELFGVKQALANCQTLARQLLERKGGGAEETNGAAEAAAEPGVAKEEGAQAAAAADGAGTARKGRTRADIYRQLKELSATLQQMEPHSPIPYLIMRACDLGALPFPQLMRALIRDDNILTEMNRELGIRDQAPATPAPAAET
jgi:type VI secretion system protein ImpA